MENPRVYGEGPFKLALVHGGPGAAGELGPLAADLSNGLGVIEPLQTEPSLQGQVRELADMISESSDPPIVVLGWSWGAWLGYILASEQPDLVSKLILVGSAPFEDKYAQDITDTRISRLEGWEIKLLSSIISDLNDPLNPEPERDLRRMAEIIKKADSYDLLPHTNPHIIYDASIHKTAWKDGQCLRKTGELLSMGNGIKCPVVAIHGDHDPHPYEGVIEPLSGVLDDFLPIVIERCGHYPWYERYARDRFLMILRDVLEGPLP